MVPPEVILDRFIRTQLRNEPGCAGYVGKLDIELVESPSFRSFLYLVQTTMNEALRLEGVNASGGIEHPPFHFDYIDVDNGAPKNAHAFEHNDYSFIVVTLPMVELILHLSGRLSRAPRVLQLLRLDPGTVEPDLLQGVLGQIQLLFLVAHEYTHHIHRHCVANQRGRPGLWTEFLPDEIVGSIDSQAQELDADGFAAYLVLEHLLRGGRRQGALADLGRSNMSAADADELLLTCFFLALLALFCYFWGGDIYMASVYRLRHPPAPVRIDNMIKVAQMACGQGEYVPDWWFYPARFQELFSVAAEVSGGTNRQTWNAQMSFFRTPEGLQYHQQLFERFEALRKKPNE